MPARCATAPIAIRGTTSLILICPGSLQANFKRKATAVGS
jgi:hypothetical protein